MKKRFALAIIIIITVIIAFSAGRPVGSTDLSNVMIDGYLVIPGENEVYEMMDCSMTKDDVVDVLGKEYEDGWYDYSQGFKKMTYHDDENDIIMEFVYLETSDGVVINKINSRSSVDKKGKN